MASVKGVSSVIAELQKFGKNIDKIIDLQTEGIAFQIATDAKNLAPRNFGKLYQSISFSKPKPLQRKVTVNEKYGAYMEFGTGALVKVPPEFDTMAKSFMGKKGGTFAQFIEAMTIYFKAKGYDTKYVWIACVNKLNNGMNPQPFLYPAWVKGKKDYLDNLKKLLLKMNKKI